VATKLNCVMALTMFFAHSVGFAADEYVRLVPSRPALPPLAPLIAVNNTSFSGQLSSLFVEMQPSIVNLGIALEFDRVANAALAEAVRTGQQGVLLKIRVAVHQIGNEAFYYPVGSGVSLVGHGPSAQAVLYFQGLNVIEESVPKGMTLVSASSNYVWITQGPNKEMSSAVEFYDIDALERYTRVVKASELASKAFEETSKGAYLEGYGRMLIATAKSEEERKTVQSLLLSRAQAVSQLKAVEQELSVRLERAEKAARAAALWNTLSAVFSVSSSAALAAASTGQPIQTSSGGSPTTAAELTQALQSLTAETQAMATAIRQRAETQRQLLNTFQESLLKAGSDRGQAIKLLH
jgi:hypothetical protein